MQVKGGTAVGIHLPKFEDLLFVSSSTYQVKVWVGQNSLKWSKEHKKYNWMYQIGCVG